jgi:hypothetical protein
VPVIAKQGHTVLVLLYKKAAAKIDTRVAFSRHHFLRNEIVAPLVFHEAKTAFTYCKGNCLNRGLQCKGYTVAESFVAEDVAVSRYIDESYRLNQRFRV